MSTDNFTPVRGGVTAPAGFLAAGLHAGIKSGPHLDLALIVSEREGPVAGLFTTSRVAAAPVVLDRLHLRRGLGRAIVANSGNANASTGKAGMRHAVEMAASVAKGLRAPLHSVFVGSTGVIGRPLSIGAIKRAIPRLIGKLRRAGGAEAARAILTTDTRAKEAAMQARVGGRLITIGGMAKGAGMIHPDMATMLAYLTTDAAISRAALQQALRAAVAESFNCITIDGDTSPNDSVLCLANGMAGNKPLKTGSAGYRVFQRMLAAVCRTLALEICRDGEGVTKVVRVVVTGARSDVEAGRVARTVGTSTLVKTALFGADANWGRIIAAAGRSGASVDPARLELSFDREPILKRGTPLGKGAERKISAIVRRKEFTITLDLRLGSDRAQVWTTDLSYEYVRINASYRT